LGANRNRVERNRITGNGRYGIAIIAQRNLSYWPATGNVIRSNLITGAGLADVIISGMGNLGNCFEANAIGRTAPAGLALLQRCGSWRLPLVGDPRLYLATSTGIQRFFNPLRDPRGGDWWKKVPYPTGLSTMPGGADAPVRIAVHPFSDFRLDLERIPLPVESPTTLSLGEER
jgi:hypothetical protein